MGRSGKDLNVEPAWMQGITGKGVVVSVFDDGMLKKLCLPKVLFLCMHFSYIRTRVDAP